MRSLTDEDAIAVLANGKDSEVGMDYWLEMRQDDVFDGRLFGGIKGGTAIKFAVWQTEDGTWKRRENRQIVEYSLDVVASIVGQRRDELLAAAAACQQ